MSNSDSQLAHFEDGVQENGNSWWSARWLMSRLDYSTWSSFKNVIGRAIQTCVNLNLDVTENFLPNPRQVNGRREEDYKLSRFACFLIANVADPKKPAVEATKAYLASIAAAAIDLNPDLLERIRERELLSVGEKAMSSAASRAGVRPDQIALFKDHGYRGMYNMSLRKLREHKGLDLNNSNTLYDYMGLSELAANSFRVTQTTERLKQYPRSGPKHANQVAHDVGAKVRSMMVADGGTPPEDLPLEEHINKGKKVLKTTSRQMAKLDEPTTKKTKTRRRR
ncbi:MAG: hypothetical protein KDK70_19390 [Myxococcales bacterium]|nr:hypothetical protein [Myxococcales bacterium]